jgi:tetratricopeptide (TPR) repeat protein
MSKSVSRVLILAVAIGFGCGAQAQPLPPPTVGDIAVDRTDVSPLEEVKKLIAAGRSKQALAFADDQLVKNPRNAQMRFVRGVILSDMNDNDAARAAFQQLTEDFPELPEPYNNLAVLYAAAGELDKARAALELALLARPDYATAHENMGDVYLQMAADAYQRAATLQPSNRSVTNKLALTREMVTKARTTR